MSEHDCVLEALQNHHQGHADPDEIDWKSRAEKAEAELEQAKAREAVMGDALEKLCIHHDATCRYFWCSACMADAWKQDLPLKHKPHCPLNKTAAQAFLAERDALRANQKTPGTVPDKWPVNGPDFNQWFLDAARFVAFVKEHPSAWLAYNPAKYLNIRIDTRDCSFVVQNRDDGEIDMDRLLKAWREDKFRGAYGEAAIRTAQAAQER